MRKNKAISTVLIIVVGIIWLNVIFKIVGNLSAGDDDVALDFSVDNPLIIPTPEDRDFELTTNYRDPFLNQIQSNSGVERNPDRSDSPIPNKINPPATLAPWPKIHYYGIVKQTKGNGGLALIKVDNYTMNLKKGEGFYEDYVITGLFRDSIVVSRGKKEHKSFYR